MRIMLIWKYVYGVLILILLLIVIALFQLPDQNLHIIACDVGQGDAILTVYKNIQILTDGGPDKSVLNCLGKHIPFWDRTIELVISTHPDADHSTGLIDVIKRYKVNKILINPIDPGTQVYSLLKKMVGGRGITVLNPSVGQSIGIGLIHLDILSPVDELLNKLTVKDGDSKLSKYEESKNTNLYSIVYKLRYKKFTGLFLGDIPPEVSDGLSVNQSTGFVNYIKIPHHGSTNGLTQNLLEKTLPRCGSQHELYTNSIEKANAKCNGGVAVISVGKKNVWGFPSEQILKMLRDQGIKILRTDEMGDIDFVTDGEVWWIKK